MKRAKFGKKSPLAYKKGETQGSYWDRIGEVAEKMIERNMTSRYAMKRLAFILMEIPSDFDSGREKSLYVQARDFLVKQDESIKKMFQNWARTYSPHNENRVKFLLGLK